MRGRKPAPAHLRLIKGDSRREGKRKLEARAAREARLPPAVLTPPAELSEDGKAEWLRVAPMLSVAGVLTEGDRTTLYAYCAAFSSWMQVQRLIAKIKAKDPTFEGILIRSAKNNLMANPLIGIANKHMNDCVRLAGELGLTPASRARMNFAEPPDDDPAEEFFR